MLKLHSWKLSPNSFKVRLVLHELGLPFQIQEVEILKAEGQSETFKALNPNGKVPVLEDDALVLWESNAILLYLARKAGQLLPREAAGQALVDQWLFWQAAHYYQPVVHLALERIVKPMFQQPSDQAMVESQTRDFDRLSQVLEDHLTHYEWLVGEFSIADLGVAATLQPRAQLGLEVTNYPFLAQWLAKIENLDSWKKAEAGEELAVGKVIPAKPVAVPASKPEQFRPKTMVSPGFSAAAKKKPIENKADTKPKKANSGEAAWDI